MRSFILMTATVAPSTLMPGTARSDPALRLAEYLAAFDHYLALDDALVDGIILLENSGFDLAPFRERHARSGSRKTVHLVNVPDDYDHSKGKGYGEFLMIDRGLAQLAASGAIAPEDRLWKVTGRLIVANMAQMMARAPRSFDFYCDLRKVPLIGESLGGNRWAELRLIAFTMRGYYALLRGQYDSDFVLEKSFFEILHDNLGSGALAITPRFAIQPTFVGYSGFSNQSYLSPSKRAKNALRAVGRRLLPALWL
jgi:hypothetical protein